MLEYDISSRSLNNTNISVSYKDRASILSPFLNRPFTLLDHSTLCYESLLLSCFVIDNHFYISWKSMWPFNNFSLVEALLSGDRAASNTKTFSLTALPRRSSDAASFLKLWKKTCWNRQDVTLSPIGSELQAKFWFWRWRDALLQIKAPIFFVQESLCELLVKRLKTSFQ